MVKIHYHKITLRVGLWISFLVVTTRNFKCGFFSAVLFGRIKYFSLQQNMKENCEEANEHCSNFTFSIGSKCNNSNAV